MPTLTDSKSRDIRREHQEKNLGNSGSDYVFVIHNIIHKLRHFVKLKKKRKVQNQHPGERLNLPKTF